MRPWGVVGPFLGDFLIGEYQLADDVHVLATSWRSRFKLLTEAVLDTIFPPVCANCEKVGVLLCADCLAEMSRLNEPLCQGCGRSVSRYRTLCRQCRDRPASLPQLRAAVLYLDPVPRIVHQLKYNGVYALAEPLAALMAEAWPRWEEPVDLLLAIPLHPKRQRSRGYNQSEYLTQHLRSILDLPGESGMLKRIKDTRPQVDLTPSERMANVVGAFWADARDVAGKRIVMIDDVCTTGSTLTEAGKALLAAGARKVSGYCLARAP